MYRWCFVWLKKRVLFFFFFFECEFETNIFHYDCWLRKGDSLINLLGSLWRIDFCCILSLLLQLWIEIFELSVLRFWCLIQIVLLKIGDISINFSSLWWRRWMVLFLFLEDVWIINFCNIFSKNLVGLVLLNCYDHHYLVALNENRYISCHVIQLRAHLSRAQRRNGYCVRLSFVWFSILF